MHWYVLVDILLKMGTRNKPVKHNAYLFTKNSASIDHILIRHSLEKKSTHPHLEDL